ncbi:acetylornithine transaminase [Candidatus Albibeggiatoa sp. nov. NOAA]|uniref:acetylornithine transaminase n=1 Tax=Candidatus Albibeggiatoa sp. nov. NOAA TaxID=3162724 RepID=UPI0032F27AA8|nr:acetylornithine transaminase [Thiotrichaceae bacterium]
MATLMSNYARLPVTFTKGEGALLWDTEGQSYLDALSGIAVCNLGHAHPNVTAAICEQAQTLVHTSNIYGIEHQRRLADRLISLTGMENAFFCNSGAEANEAMIKLARLYARRKNIPNPAIIVTHNSFHGRTLATLSATGNPKVQQGFEPLVLDFIHVPYNDVAAIQQLAEQDNIVAVMVEPVQGEGGVNVPADDYLNQLRTLCDQQQWLLMLDEIQTGIGRTGQWFAYQHNQILPDVLSLAKGLGNGVPIGACLARGVAAELFSPGTHGTTFGGNPLACRTALAVLDSIEQDNLLQRVNELSEYLKKGFATQLSEVQGVQSIRAKGLMIGIELDHPCAELVQQALAQHLLINVTAGNTIRLLPPFILTDSQADKIILTVSGLIKSFLAMH